MGCECIGRHVEELGGVRLWSQGGLQGNSGSPACRLHGVQAKKQASGARWVVYMSQKEERQIEFNSARIIYVGDKEVPIRSKSEPLFFLFSI